MPEPSAEAAIAAAGQLEGWAFFDAQPEPLKRSAEIASSERAANAAAHLARLFAADPAFRDAVEIWLDLTLRRASFGVAHLSLDPMQAYAYGMFREGQNSLMTAILNQIALGRKDRPEPGRE